VEDFENIRVELMWGSVDRKHTKHGPCIYVVQSTTRGVLLSLRALRGLVSIPHLLTLHWSILHAPLGTVVTIVTSLSTLKASISNRSVGRTRSHWGSRWGVLTSLLVSGVWSLWTGMLQLLNGVVERLIVPLNLILPRVTT
jgi:hypothetical protein